MGRAFERTARTRLRQMPSRGVYDKAAVQAILDEGLICHIGFIDKGQPVTIPANYARSSDVIYIHGSTASRMFRTLASGSEACLTVTLLDGLVLGRSAFRHAVNYRSVVVFGRMHRVEDREEKLAALRALSEHVVPGRWPDVRPPNTRELNATTVLAMPLAEASAKVRSGPPGDEKADYALNIWAGVIPLRLVAGEPETDARVPAGVAVPRYALRYRRDKSPGGAPSASLATTDSDGGGR